MKYIKAKDLNKYLRNNNLRVVGSIDATGSVKGMNKQFGWDRYEKIKSGKYIYAVQ